MPLLTIIQLYRGSYFYWWSKQEYPEKTIDLPEFTAVIPACFCSVLYLIKGKL
jgi:hypothetical protein